ncbi:hypothetical protein D806_016000 [Mycolicibacterium smegmatis MKD8]|uniref:Uncharacterized protein n=1 Tax=Mycolicibacterium smegmatis (strain MKD8) TaxID=1214915 RepID=A0A2U9PLF9_MYCSE|nr:hypothetical protein D806_016000 [Mycolicibacterium smegmatis MKD8]
MRPTKRRNPATGPRLDVAGFYRDMLTGRYPAVSAPTYRDVEEWSRTQTVRSTHGIA